ncbi:MAG: hypothetical protein IT426_13760 [Pirellulales bacterium]|nr:hypothetical protein [Pirellulales bacterium]
MTPVEQVIYTSAVTERGAGYQIVARSPGLHEEDARELAVWCPSHDSFLDLGPEAASHNFHPLPSGSYCISRTVPAGWEYSGRGGVRVYTHCLIAAPETLLRFANNPFALLKAALAGGMLEIRDPLPGRLEPIALVGGATMVDQNLLIELSNQPGPQAIAALVQAARDAVCLAVAGPAPTEKLIAGLINCLPLTHRTEFSFATGLKFSPRRPFRLVALPSDPAERRWLEHHNNVSTLDLDGRTSPASPSLDGWSRFIERLLSTGRTAFFSTQMSKRRFNLAPEDLPVLGLQLLEDLDATALQNQCTRREYRPETDASENSDGERSANEFPRIASIGADAADAEKLAAFKAAFLQHAHAAHRRFENSEAEPAKAKGAHSGPAQTLDPESPAILEKLELLDDLVYESIGGNARAMRQLQTVWPTLQKELGARLLFESREQYLRYALSVWEDCVEKDGRREPTRAVQALDVLCLLFEGE